MLKATDGAFAPGFILSALSGYLLIPKARNSRLANTSVKKARKRIRKRRGRPQWEGLCSSPPFSSPGRVFLLDRSRPTRESAILGLMLAYGLIGFIMITGRSLTGRSLGLRAREKIKPSSTVRSLVHVFLADRGSAVVLPFSGSNLDCRDLVPSLGYGADCRYRQQNELH